MNAPELYIYIFVRQDLPIAEQIVHSSHAMLHAAVHYYPPETEGIPAIVVIGIPDVAAINRVLKKLESNAIVHFAWRDPDIGAECLAIATEPMAEDKKSLLKNYRLWNNANNAVVAQTPQEHSPAK